MIGHIMSQGGPITLVIAEGRVDYRRYRRE